MTGFERGEVLLVRYPDSNLLTYKLRPALFVQNQAVATELDQQIVVMITSNTRMTGPTRVFVSNDSTEGQAMGLLADSVIVADNIATVAGPAIERARGHCPVIQQVELILQTGSAGYSGG